MATTKTPIEIDDDALAEAAKYLGTRTKKDTVNAALREVVARFSRLRSFNELGTMADDGYFDDFTDKSSYRR